MTTTKIKYLGIDIHDKDPDFVDTFSRTLLAGHYVRKDETIPQAFARAATAFCAGDLGLAQRVYDYAYNGYFMFASPVLSNAPKSRWINDEQEFLEKLYGLPISCFAAEVPDTAPGQVKFLEELASLSMMGGGFGAHNSIRAVSDKAPGPIPYEKVLDGAIGYFRQGKTRRGAMAYYMDSSHPDIVEHILFRVPGGDSKRRSDNRMQFHTGVNLTDDFIKAVLEDLPFELRCHHSKEVYETLRARDLWEKMLETRALTGEPFMVKIDAANRALPVSQKDKGLKVRGSNLCTEILLPTDEQRTFVCCLSSVNLETFDEWKDTRLVQDLIRFLDNIIEFFITHAPDSIAKAKFSAAQERALGLGALGWHSYLQKHMVPFEGGGFNSAVQLTHKVFKLIKDRAVEESKRLAVERGEPPDMVGTGLRNSRLLAIAPNANSSDLIGTSPSTEPWYRNVFVKDTRVGSFVIKNKYLKALLASKGKDTEEVWADILAHDTSVQHLDFLDDREKAVFKTAVEMDQHWLIELADHRGGYICQAQSLNLFFTAGMTRQYVNSVHLKFLRSENVYTLYYFRTERETKVDSAKAVERKALVDWNAKEDCIACQG